MLLFVYGSLKKGLEGHELIKKCRAQGIGHIYATLYDLNVGFPAAVLEGTRALTEGELYEVDEDDLEEIDEYEGYNAEDPHEGLYIRQEITVELAGRQKTKAQCYVMEPENLTRFFADEIKTGKWTGPRKN